MAITEVQRATNTDDTGGGTGSIASIDVTLSSPPTDGNTLIICIMAKDGNTPSINSVTSSNTTWTQAANIANGSNTDAAAAIFYASGISNAGSTITTNLSNTRTVAVVVFEYSDIDTVNPLNSTGTDGTTSTGQVSLTLVGNNNTDTDGELAIALVTKGNNGGTSPTSTFVGSAFNQEEYFNVLNPVTGLFGRAHLLGLVASRPLDSGIPISVTLNPFIGDSDVIVGALASFRPAPLGKISNPDPSDGTTGVFPSKILSWSAAPGGPTGYRVYVSENPDPTVDGYTVTGNTFFDPPNFNNNTTIYWRVDAYNDSEVVAGDVFSFTTNALGTVNPADISSPSSGDRAFDSFNVTGTIDPGVGLNVELIGNNSLLFDGYVETDLDGDFSLPVEFNPTMANSKLFLNLTQTGRLGTSNELTISLFQARNESAPLLPYTARKLSFDDRTTAFYTLSASTQAGRTKTYFDAPTHELSFSDSGVPSGWAERGGNPVGLLGDGIMTSLGDNITATTSALEDTSINWTDGASYSSSYRATTLSSDNDQPLVFFWRHVSSDIDNSLGHRMKNDRLDAVRIAHPEVHQFVPDDQQNLTPGDWYDFQHYAKRLRDQLGTQHIYVETYVNGELYFTGFAGVNGLADQVFLGQPFSGNTYEDFDINYFWADQDKDPMIDGPFWSVDGDFNKAFDQSGNPAPSPTLGTTREGLEPPFETALTLNGVDEYLVNDNALFELSNTFTLEFWFNRQGDDTSSNMRLFGKEVINASSHFGYFVRLNNSGALDFFIAGSGVTNSASTPAGSIRNNTWYYCAITYDNQATKIYLDGRKVFDGTTGPYTASGDEFYIGVDGTTTNADFFSGQIASLRISDGTIRTESEIYNNYFSNFDYNQQGFETDSFTVANYDFVNAEDYAFVKSGNEEPIVDTEILFNTNDDLRRYFFPIHIFQNGSNTFADAYVENNKIIFTFDHETGTSTSVIMASKIILDKDFDYQAFFTYEQPIDIGGNSSFPIRIFFQSSARRNIVAYIERSNLQRFQINRFSGSTVDVNTTNDRPDKVIFRATCENNDIKYRFGRDGDTEATTEFTTLTNVSARNSLVLPDIFPNINGSAPSQTYQFTIDKITISDREGNSPEDGYAVVDPLLAHPALSQPFATRFSKFGGVAPDFNNSAFTVDNHESLNTTRFSIEILFAADTLQDSRLFLRSKDGYTGNVGISLNSSGDFTVDFEDSLGASGSMDNIGSYEADKPHYVALTYENNKFRFFVDGSQVGSFVGNFDGKFGHDVPFYIGADRAEHGTAGGGSVGDTDFFDGEIAHLRWSNKARTPIEIFNFYRGAGLNEPT